MVDVKVKKERNRIYQRKWFAANRSVQQARVNRNNEKVRSRNREAVRQYLLKHPCIDCGEDDVIVLEFDHVRGIKRSAISILANWSTVEALMDEVKKCDVRCANCHRRRTAKQLKWRKLFLDT